MIFWLFMLAMDLLIPCTMYVFGRRWTTGPPPERSNRSGYRTPVFWQALDAVQPAHGSGDGPRHVPGFGTACPHDCNLGRAHLPALGDCDGPPHAPYGAGPETLLLKGRQAPLLMNRA